MTSAQPVREIKEFTEALQSTCTHQETFEVLTEIIQKCETIIVACEEGWY